MQPAEARANAERLSTLTTLLGERLPAPAAGDDVGIEKPGFEVTRAFAADAPRLSGHATRLRATAFRGRVHTLELTFLDACDAPCARSLVATLEGWVGPLRRHQEGRAGFWSAEVDTVRVELEVFPQRPALTRLLLRCTPLWNAAQGRPSRLHAIDEPRPSAVAARCRPLPY